MEHSLVVVVQVVSVLMELRELLVQVESMVAMELLEQAESMVVMELQELLDWMELILELLVQAEKMVHRELLEQVHREPLALAVHQELLV